MKNKSNNHFSKKKSSKNQSHFNSSSDNLHNQPKIDLNNVSKWSIESTGVWLNSIGYGDCEKYFIDHSINGRALILMEENDLKEIIKNNVGKRKNLYHLIKVLQIRYARYMNESKTNIFSTSDEDDLSNGSDIEKIATDSESDELSSTKLNNTNFKEDSKNPSKVSNNTTYESTLDNKCNSSNRHLINEDILGNKKSNINNSSINKRKKTRLDLDKEMSLPNFCENCLKKFDSSPYTNYGQNSTNFTMRNSNGEKRKTFASALYLFVTSLWSAFMLTVCLFIYFYLV
jgi:hypothetical protein